MNTYHKNDILYSYTFLINCPFFKYSYAQIIYDRCTSKFIAS